MMVWNHFGEWSIVSDKGYCIALNIVNGKRQYIAYTPEPREWLGVFTTSKGARAECEEHLANGLSDSSR